MKERRAYAQEFKLDAVELTNSSDKTVKEIALNLDVFVSAIMQMES